MKPTIEDIVLKLLKNIDISKAAGVDYLIRPISLLPLISKIFEEIGHDQIIDYLAQYNISYKYQSGFRTKHSTDLCLLYLNDEILQDFDNGLFSGMILIDLQKAFDTIDHNILLEKLKAIGFCDDTVNWFHSYLTDRAFLVSIENKYSSISKISCGVPQGSILGPLLFLIYVNNMKQAMSSDLLL